ncbi:MULTISPECIES: pilus assembly protein TadG-related protein [Brucella]|uniref:Probable transmembrane protein n=1 Tax=Ochrobactrum soli TaxID=2448455 RepID=A0A2P9HQ97_9HYPH|nr:MULTISPECIES: pilus assembly protein TadG-related protein [Brucella]MDX4074351.1 TadG family pilus assembly protein [Brucella sp. NBRC 113783]SPL66261.1 Probable transmembrane protein [[Ochrobactrum] soli]
MQAGGLRFLKAREGNLATMAALVAPLFLAIAALTIDSSSLYLERRQLQNMADLAAISGASTIGTASDAVKKQLQANGLDPVMMTGAYDPSIVKGKTDNLTRVWVETGKYTADKSVAVGSRFVAGGTSPDAVRVTLAKPGNLYFGQALMDRPAVSASGMAASHAEAAFSIGSRLASLNTNESALNGLLGGLLGTTLNLKLLDYNALAATDINLLGFLDKLAPQVGLTAGTYDQLLNTDVSVGVLAKVMADVVTNNATAKAALNVLGKNAAALSTKLPVGKLLGLGSLANASIGSAGNYNITANVLQLVTASAILGGKHQIDVGTGLDLGGLATVTVSVAIGEPAQSTPYFRVGAVGSLVRTAQIRISLYVGLLNSSVLGLITLGDLKLPIYVDVASAEGELKSVSCPAGPQSAKVGIGVTTGIAGVYLGNLSDPDFKNLNKKPVVTSKKIAQIKVLGIGPDVYAKAEIPLGDDVQRILNFSYSDIQNKKIQTASSTKLLGGLTSALLSKMEVNVDLGLISLDLSGVFSLLGALLTPISALLDNLLFALLDLLGVKLGQADVQVTGVICQQAALTQ